MAHQIAQGRLPAGLLAAVAVSYTHLPTGPKRLHSPVRTLFFRCKNTRQKERNLTPVSYPHLDVYKRPAFIITTIPFILIK